MAKISTPLDLVGTIRPSSALGVGLPSILWNGPSTSLGIGLRDVLRTIHPRLRSGLDSAWSSIRYASFDTARGCYEECPKHWLSWLIEDYHRLMGASSRLHCRVMYVLSTSLVGRIPGCTLLVPFLYLGGRSRECLVSVSWMSREGQVSFFVLNEDFREVKANIPGSIFKIRLF